MTTATLNPTDDSYADENAPDTNYGSNTSLLIRGSFIGSRYGFMEFDISSIPVGSIIDSVTLNYYVTSATWGTYDFDSVASQIDEATLTWNNKPSIDANWNSSSAINSPLGWKSISVNTSWVESAISSGWIGIRISSSISTYQLTVSSSESSNKPYLTINYGGEYYVKVGGNDASAGTSWATAWATVNKAATTVTDGDVVHIGFGTYSSEPANNDIAPINAGAIGIKYLPETAITGGGTGSVIVEVN